MGVYVQVTPKTNIPHYGFGIIIEPKTIYF